MRRLLPALVVIAVVPGLLRGQDAARVQALVDQLAAPTHAARLAAQRELLSLGPAIQPLLDRARVPPGWEAARQWAYVRDHLVPPPVSITVPAGRHRVGSDDRMDQNPRREVELPAFTLDRTEVTNLEFYAFVQASGAKVPPEWSEHGGRYPYGAEALPVQGVSFADAGRFAAWVGGRLPTADEWEVAAHAGRGTPFPWGDEQPGLLQNASGRLPAVGSETRDRSPLGILDLAGSLREWVVGSAGAAFRGGCFNGRLTELRVTRAPSTIPDGRGLPTVGFRVADRGTAR